MKKSGFNTNAIKTTTTITATAAATKNAIAVTATAANSAVATATATVITDETTLNELIRIARNNTVAKPKATPKITQLRKNANCVISIERQDVRFSLSVYDNGYAAYETDGRRTVIDLDEISGVKYRTNYGHLEFERSDFDREWLGKLPWASALVLLGEEQVSQNIFEDKAHDYVGEGDHDENEDETKKPNNPAFAAHIDDPETAYIRRETRNEIKRALSKARSQMTEEQAEAFILYYNQDMTLKEIGTTLNISSPAVLFRLNGAKRKLRKNMERFL